MSARLLLACLALLPAVSFAQEGTGARISPHGPMPRAQPVAPLADAVEDPATLLRLAERTLANGRLGETAELIERAEARLLTRSELASRADRPVESGVAGELAAAREALVRRDRGAAGARLAAALSRLESGASAPMAPAAGGGGMEKEPLAAPMPAPVPPPASIAPAPAKPAAM